MTTTSMTRAVAPSLPCVALVCALAVPLRAQTFETTLTPDEVHEDLFGQAVALEGTTLAVGAPSDNDGDTDTGSVHVFVHDGGAWQLQAELDVDPSDLYGANLGASLALDGDTLLAGAFGVSDGNWTQPGFQRGAAYVFERDAGTWTRVARLQPALAAGGDHFGLAVALFGDLAVVGAPYADPSGEGSGRAWVYREVAGVWTEEALLEPDDGGADQRFGRSVAVGTGGVFVGAPIADGVVPGAGAVYRFTFDGSVWTQADKLVAPDGASGDRFGLTLALDGTRLAIGAPQRTVGGKRHAGAVAVWEDAAGWTQQAWVGEAVPRTLAHVGSALDLQGERLIVGLPEDDDAAPQAGAARIFVLTGGVWSEGAKLLPAQPTSGDALGESVALSGDRAAAGTVWRTYLPLFGIGNVDLWTGVTGGGR
ncbi:MAG: hypothetical protein H6825_03440 [Planctomycetes bacterium]|nr:hypothetical protein [Planctomycetota bacterium]